MPAEKKTRLGLVGCGAIAEIYHLPALQQSPHTAGHTLLADANPARLSAMSDKFSVAGCVQDFRELAGQVQGVIVATPPASHFEICRWFLERGIHVLCEKPLTESLAEAEELVRIADQRGAHLAVNQTRRFFPTYQKIRELLAASAASSWASTSVAARGFSHTTDLPAFNARRASGAWVLLGCIPCTWSATRAY